MAESEITEKKDEADEENEDETESKELSDKLTLLSMKSLLTLTHPLSSNAISLLQEAEEVIPKIESFIASLELFSNVTENRRFRRMKVKEGSHTAKVLERIFKERIELGMYIVNRVNDLLQLERQTIGRNTLRERSSSSTTDKHIGSLQEYEKTLQKVVRRFTRILDSKGIEHNLERELIRRPPYPEEESKPYTSTNLLQEINEPLKEESTPQEAELEEKEVANAIEFLNRVVSRNNLSIMFRNIPNKDFSSCEYFCACDFDQFTVTAKGPSRLTARINSAAKMIKLIMREQQKGNSISMEKFVLLSDDEIEAAIRILCITDNYAHKLRKVCEMHTAHSPKFITLSEKPIYTVRCEALGYKSIGTHKKLYMAKKIAAKKLLMQMPNEGEPKNSHVEHHVKPTYKRDNKVKIVQTYRESSLN